MAVNWFRNGYHCASQGKVLVRPYDPYSRDSAIDCYNFDQGVKAAREEQFRRIQKEIDLSKASFEPKFKP